MNKKFFILILILMSLSLLGIISVQSYFIKSNLDKSEQQFSLNVNTILLNVSEAIQKREYSQYVYKFNELMNSGVNIDTTAINNLYFISENNGSNETIIYRNGIIEESLKLPSFLDINIDSINITRVSNEREQKLFSVTSSGDTKQFTPEQLLLRIGEISRSKEILFETAYKDLAKRNPIHRRVSKKEINNLITKALSEHNLILNFEFGIFDKELLTRVQSESFDYNNQHENLLFNTPIFTDNNNSSDFSLNMYFPNLKNQFLSSGSSYVEAILLSIIFTIIIVIVYISTISQLLKQKKIAQIKSDFINNMTHEFKTPIATINLVLDSIKNPKIIDNKDKVIGYLNMIKVENNRMNDQVENVLRISRLERNELNIKKSDHDLHSLIHKAVSHLDLIMKNKQGQIELELNSNFTNIRANKTHFTNVIINIIDNAIKYSDKNPIIKISTHNIDKILNEKDIILSISDNGIGMSKDVQSKIFEKFYREQSGDLHNVKGHGLGLAYVKKIVKFHRGEVSVDSSPGNGSTFKIILPVYNNKINKLI
ncbi:MAG: two-component system phosphate regulon sensor histidine kinase PhoR [Flavobacteriaceae bacterium]|jgi:two-component system phosphate regulon sensor histidine kinase PhoR